VGGKGERYLQGSSSKKRGGVKFLIEKSRANANCILKREAAESRVPFGKGGEEGRGHLGSEFFGPLLQGLANY